MICPMCGMMMDNVGDTYYCELCGFEQGNNVKQRRSKAV